MEISDRDRLFDAAIEALESGMKPREVMAAVEDAILEWKTRERK